LIKSLFTFVCLLQDSAFLPSNMENSVTQRPRYCRRTCCASNDVYQRNRFKILSHSRTPYVWNTNHANTSL